MVRRSRSSLVFALAVLERLDVGPGGNGRQAIQCLFAPLRHNALMTKADVKREQLAGICGCCGAIREALFEDALIAAETVAVVLESSHKVGAQRFNIDAVKRIETDEQIVLDRRRAAWPGCPVLQRGSALGCEGIDQLVGLARLHDLAALNVAPFAKPREFAINLLMVGLPKETDRGVERLGEFITRHRTFRQTCEDCVTKCHFANPSVHVSVLDFMHQSAYASICILTAGISRRVRSGASRLA